MIQILSKRSSCFFVGLNKWVLGLVEASIAMSFNKKVAVLNIFDVPHFSSIPSGDFSVYWVTLQ